jgi:preprotein translocase subunit Sss1
LVNRTEVYAALDGERAYQLFRANAIGDAEEHGHTLSEWTVYIQDYLNELTHSLSRVWRQDGLPTKEELDTLRKITAMGLAAMEQLGAPRREGY